MARRYVCIFIPKTGSSWLDEFTRRVDELRVERRKSESAMFARIHDFLPESLGEWYAGGRQGARTFPHQAHVPWSRMWKWMEALPVVFALRGIFSWHLSRWLFITSDPIQFPEYVRLNNTTRPDRSFPWDASDHQRLVENWLAGGFSHASWSALNAEGYWFYTQRLKIPDTTHRQLGFCPEWPTIGFYTMRILLMLHRNPGWLFRRSERELEEYFESGRWRGDVCRGWCLRQEHLKEDACRVLEDELGYRRDDLERALASMPEKVNVAECGRRERAERELRGNEALWEKILHAERLAHRYILPTLTREGGGGVPAGSPSFSG